MADRKKHETDKQPWEERPLGIDLTEVMTTGETIQAEAADVTSITITDVDGNDTTSTMYETGTLLATGFYLDAIVKGGDANASPYNVRFRCTTSLSHKWEEDVELTVRDRKK